MLFSFFQIHQNKFSITFISCIVLDGFTISVLRMFKRVFLFNDADFLLTEVPASGDVVFRLSVGHFLDLMITITP